MCIYKKSILTIILISLLVICFAFNIFAFDLNLNSNNLILINKENSISRLYIPKELENLGTFMPINKKEILLQKDAFLALKQMYQDLKSQNLDLIAVSGYRNYEYQQNLFDREVSKYEKLNYSREKSIEIAKTMTATPGTSEHQTGLCVDLSDKLFLYEEFSNTEVGKWLLKNCKNYGFILRYPQNKTNITNIIYEPWHFRFVGKPHSIYITDNNLTLEEYIKLLQDKKHISFIHGNNEYNIYHTNNERDEFENIINISYDNSKGYIVTTSKKNNINILLTVAKRLYKTL